MGISREQALDCLRSSDLIGIGMEADAVRRGLHPENVVSYSVDCVVRAGDGLMEVIEAAGTASVCLAVVPGMTFAEFAETLAAVGRRFPALRVHGPSGGVLLQLADAAGLSADGAIVRLRDAGLSSFAGDDLRADADSGRLLRLHHAAHRAGMGTAAGMIFGAGESLEDRVDRLFAIREMQAETGGFVAFTPWSFLPAAGAIEAPTAVEYMRTLAVARMVLDNVENVEANCVAQGLKVVQMALRFGANDAGAIRADGMKNFTEEDLRRVIRDAGFKPVERDTLYRTMFLNN
jgi:cyclic dehypoxanthinyl futalosine synthase